MAFVPRTFEQILTDMINHVRVNTTLTDFTVGSVIRTILEAAALEDDEQYHQMVQLLDAFRVATSTGSDLDKRAADLNLIRFEAKAAYVKIKIRNDALTYSELTYDAASASITTVLDDTSEFPTSYPYDIRIGEGTAQVEDVSVTLNDTVTNTLTHGALVNNHSAGERCSVAAGSDVTVPRGVLAEVEATTSNLAIQFSSSENGVVLAGNYESGLIDGRALEPGSYGNTAADTIKQFVATPPFTGAGVTNPSASSGGRDRESDSDFRNRILQRYDELSRGTPKALEYGVLGVEDDQTGQRIITSKLQENFTTLEHKLYVDDGTGLVPERTVLARTEFAAAATGGATSSIQVNNVSEFPSGGWLLLSPDIPARSELIEYTAKDTTTNKFLVLTGPVVNNHLIGEEAMLVDKLELAEEGQNFFQLTDFPNVSNSYEIYDDVAGQFERKTEGVDYFLNRTNGEIQYYGAGLPTGTQVLGSYAHYTGLLQLVQKVVNGDEDDQENYPGLSAGGVIIYVDVPILRTIDVLIAIVIDTDFDKNDVQDEVRRVVAGYIDSLNIGGNVVLARIIERAMSVGGVDNAVISAPDSDQVVLENELPVSYDSSGITRVTVI